LITTVKIAINIYLTTDYI